MPVLDLEHVGLTYPSVPPVHALRDVSLTIEQGEFVAIVGRSGGGKSTLLNVLGLLDVPTSGRYLIDGVDAVAGGERTRAKRRSTEFSFVFQSFHLLERRPVIDSVELGLVYRGLPARIRRTRAMEALDAVGLGPQWQQSASTLSGGQRQRVAIARTLASHTPVVLADEPTGNLDSAAGDDVLALLKMVVDTGSTVIMVTHDTELAGQAARIVEIHDGVSSARLPQRVSP